MATISPVLNFAGRCEEAFTFYQGILDGELELNRFSEMPADESFPPVADEQAIMHVALTLGDGQVLMGSDVPPEMGGVTVGDNVQVSVNPYSSEEAKRVFDALADGGEVLMPFARMFWGADFGMCVDRFGVRWMVNYQLPEES